MPFVTPRILLTEYNSVQQNTNSVGQNYILSTELHSVQQNSYSVQQNTILSNRIRILSNRIRILSNRIRILSNSDVTNGAYGAQFGQNYILLTECNSVRQNCILLDKIVFCQQNS